MAGLPGSRPDALLAEELKALQAFSDLLQREQAALTDGKTDALAALVEEKSSKAAELTRLLAAREQALVASGFQQGRGGMDTWLGRLPPADPSHDRWRALLALTLEVRDQNELNGKLINLHIQNNQQALTALLAATERAMTYGPDGQQQASTGGGRTLGVA